MDRTCDGTIQIISTRSQLAEKTVHFHLYISLEPEDGVKLITVGMERGKQEFPHPSEPLNF
jgi:hypothetical protein